MISLHSALFLSYLPYRKKIYKSGGWPRFTASRISDLKQQLSLYFEKEIFTQAEKKADRFLLRYGEDPESCRFHFIHDGSYPEYLRLIYDPPPVIFCSGDPLPETPGIAVVGTRNPASVVRNASAYLVRQIKKKKPDAVIVSGFARGVDFYSHRAAVENALHNVGVLGAGIFHPSPVSSLELLRMADAAGTPFTLVSEFPPDTEPAAYNFPRRNRIIAGLCESLIVMQAPEKSGALISAHFAMEEGRDVYVFDHPLISSSGFNEGGRKLIGEGAGLLNLDLDNRIIRRNHFNSEEEQLEFFARSSRGELSWMGGDYFFDVS